MKKQKKQWHELPKCVVFHAPEDMHVVLGSPADLIRYEKTVQNHHFAMIECMKLKNKYAPKNPSGYPAEVYKYCTLDQWNEFINAEKQLVLIGG